MSLGYKDAYIINHVVNKEKRIQHKRRKVVTTTTTTTKNGEITTNTVTTQEKTPLPKQIVNYIIPSPSKPLIRSPKDNPLDNIEDEFVIVDI